MSLKGQKPTPLMTSLTKKTRNPKPIFF